MSQLGLPLLVRCSTCEDLQVIPVPVLTWSGERGTRLEPCPKCGDVDSLDTLGEEHLVAGEPPTASELARLARKDRTVGG